MATTTNYGWTTPDNTDLVKDGALAIRTLGSAIDTSMNTALGTKKAGLVLLNTTSFSGVSSQSINDVFSATYDDYRVILKINSFSVDAAVQFRLRVSGADNSTANYYNVYPGLSTNGVSFTTNDANATVGYFTQGDSATTDLYGWTGDIFRPFTAIRTRFAGIVNGSTGAGVISSQAGGAIHFVDSSFTGLTIIASAGNISGSIAIYGYNK